MLMIDKKHTQIIVNIIRSETKIQFSIYINLLLLYEFKTNNIIYYHRNQCRNGRPCRAIFFSRIICKEVSLQYKCTFGWGLKT